jgi:hypothetical protein
MNACANRVELAKGEILRVSDARTREITILSGVIWMTGTPSSGDIVLRAGECHRFGAEYPHVIEAMTEATVSLGNLDLQKA